MELEQKEKDSAEFQQFTKQVEDVPDTNDYICPECGGKLNVMRIDEWPGLLEGSDIIAACSQCELDWIWHLAHDGTAGKKRRFFHG